MECINKLFERIVMENYTPNSIESFLDDLIVDIEVALGKYELSMEAFQIEGDTFTMYRKIVEEAMEYMFKKLASQKYNFTNRNKKSNRIY